MSYVLAVLGAFWALHTLKLFVDTSPQVWAPIAVVLAIGSSALFVGPSSWYVGFPVAGVVEFLDLLENLLIVKGDELVNKVLRRQR